MADRGSMRITWLGHSCFKVESQGYAVIFDPYEDGRVPGFKPLRETADLVLCSHEHGDHNFRAGIELTDHGPLPFQVTEIAAFHDDHHGELRGSNTIRILDDGCLKIAHLGDLGCGLNEDQAAQLEGLDAVMIPVGGFYTIDAAQARKLVERIHPRVAIPMHYRSETFGYDVLGTLDAFTDQCDLVVEYPGNGLELTKETEPHTAVLKYE